MGLTLLTKPKPPQPEFKSEVGLISTTRLAALVQCHPYRVKDHFADAFVRYRAGAHQPFKLYSLQGACDILSATSGWQIEPHHLGELLTPEQALDILVEHGQSRSLHSLRYWKRTGHLRAVQLGVRYRYLRSDIVAMVERLPERPHGRIKAA